MEHFNITYVCPICLRGSKVFQIYLSLFHDNGRLKYEVRKMDSYKMKCDFCKRKSKLDFYGFSHPDVICHLKRLHDEIENMKQASNILIDAIKYYTNKNN